MCMCVLFVYFVCDLLCLVAWGCCVSVCDWLTVVVCFVCGLWCVFVWVVCFCVLVCLCVPLMTNRGMLCGFVFVCVVFVCVVFVCARLRMRLCVLIVMYCVMLYGLFDVFVCAHVSVCVCVSCFRIVLVFRLWFIV